MHNTGGEPPTSCAAGPRLPPGDARQSSLGMVPRAQTGRGSREGAGSAGELIRDFDRRPTRAPPRPRECGGHTGDVARQIWPLVSAEVHDLGLDSLLLDELLVGGFVPAGDGRRSQVATPTVNQRVVPDPGIRDPPAGLRQTLRWPQSHRFEPRTPPRRNGSRWPIVC